MIYILCCKNIDASELAELMYNCFISFLDMSQNLMSDWDILFTSKFWLSFCYYLSTKCKLFITYHLQTDDQIKHQNQILKHYLCLFINFQQDNWACWLSLIMHIYNISVHSTTEIILIKTLMSFWRDLCINVNAELSEDNTLSA